MIPLDLPYVCICNPMFCLLSAVYICVLYLCKLNGDDAILNFFSDPGCIITAHRLSVARYSIKIVLICICFDF